MHARRYVISAGALLAAIALLVTAVSHGAAIAVASLIVGTFTNFGGFVVALLVCAAPALMSAVLYGVALRRQLPVAARSR